MVPMDEIAKLKVFPADTCLSSTLAQAFIKAGEKNLENVLIILPTQRLGTQLCASLARSWGALIPPDILTMESLIKKSKLDSELRVCSDASFDFLAQRLLSTGQYKYVKPGQERELRLILGELYENGVRVSAFPNLKEHIQNDIYRGEAHVDSLLLRVQEIEEILEIIEQRLRDKGLWTKAEATAAAATKFSVDELSLSQYDAIYLVGFTSLSPSWMPAIESLCKLGQAEVWLSEKPDLYHENSPLSDLIDRFQGLCKRDEDPDGISFSRQTPRLVQVESPFAEIAKSIDLVRLLMEAGHEPSQIAVLLSNEGLYGPLISSLNNEFLEDSNLALTRPFKTSKPGRSLEKMVQVLETESLLKWIDWISDPSVCRWIQDNHEFSLDSFVWNLSQSQASNLDAFLKDSEEGLALLKDLKQLMIDFPSGKLSLDNWVQRTYTWINKCRMCDELEENESQSIEDALKHFLHVAEQISEINQDPISRQEYFEFLQTQLLEADIRKTGEPLSGVQFLSLAEARYYPFSAAIILGCNEGTFPKALPKDELLDNFLKKKMGLPGWESLEAMEDQTFHLLKERLPQIYMLRSKEQDGEPTVTSRFVEKLQTEDNLEIYDLEFNVEKFWKELGPPPSLDKPVTGLEGQPPAKPDTFWLHSSASGVEKLIRCPYRYLLNKLTVRAVEFCEDEDPRREGEWLHKVLECFFTGSHEDNQIFTWETEDYEDFSRIALERLRTLTLILGPKNIADKPLYFHLLQHSWPQFVQHLESFYRESFVDFSRSLKEASLDSFHQAAKIKVRDILRPCHGSIDSIDFIYGTTMLTDYKRRSSPVRKESQQGVLPQLPFYALAILGLQKDFNLEQMIIGYWNIIKGEWVCHGVGEEAKQRAVPRGLAGSRSPDIKALTDTMLKTWEWRETSVLDEGRFYADPSHCSLCDYGDICRKNDPQRKEHIESQDHLKQHLNEGRQS